MSTRRPGCECPVPAGLPCLGASVERLCYLAATNPAYADQLVKNARGTPPPEKAELAAVARCPDRGGVLPHTLQPEGCGCGELSACAKGKGKRPGAVSLAECRECVRPGLVHVAGVGTGERSR